MIISIFIVDPNSQKKLFRSSAPMSQSQINHYLAEFSNTLDDQEGILEKETYNFVYLSKEDQKFGIQITKEHSIKSAFSILRFIMNNSFGDLFDSLVVIDNVLYGGLPLQLELQPILDLDSQEEKIHKMMLENKRLEMAQREKENRTRIAYQSTVSEEPKKVPVTETQQKKLQPSDKPVLVVIREKLKLKMDKENNVKENSVNGEVLMVISDAEYKHVEIKMKNLKSSFQYSPYLDKNALKKSIFRFDRERGINKSIPMLKWSGNRQSLPLSFEFWNDEEDGKFVNIVEIKANENVQNLKLILNKENVTDLEINENYETEEDSIVLDLGNLEKEKSMNVEIKFNAYDKDGLFPLSVTFKSNTLDINLDVEKIFLNQEEIKEYEVRKELDIEHYQILAD